MIRFLGDAKREKRYVAEDNITTLDTTTLKSANNVMVSIMKARHSLAQNFLDIFYNKLDRNHGRNLFVTELDIKFLF
ncbi:hypothetical protein JCM15519_21520 [Fundidesulfovibrio butyratiphilus]